MQEAIYKTCGLFSPLGLEEHEKNSLARSPRGIFVFLHVVSAAAAAFITMLLLFVILSRSKHIFLLLLFETLKKCGSLAIERENEGNKNITGEEGGAKSLVQPQQR